MKKRFLMAVVLVACMLVPLTACGNNSKADENLSGKMEADASESEGTTTDGLADKSTDGSAEDSIDDEDTNKTSDDIVDASHERVSDSKENNLSGFIFPDSDRRYLEMTDLYELSEEECRIARNEIYARHGRIFQDSELQAYFEQFEWYKGLYEADEFDESVLNEFEKANRDLIAEYEAGLDAGFEGTWTDSYSQRCHMEITLTDDFYYEVLINWSSSAWDNTQWTFFAQYDKNQDALVYQNGRCVDQHYLDNDDVQETEVYSNGEGLIYQKDGNLYWEDKTEGIGDDCVFERD